MKLLGYPLEIWIAAGIAVLIKLQASNKLTWFGAITTILVALTAGVILHQPVLAILALNQVWAIPLAIIISLSTENLCKVVLELSADRAWILDWVRYFVEKKK